MKKSLSLLAVAGLTLALASCETIVDVEAPAHTPRLALTYTLSNQAPTADYRQFFSGRDLYVSTSQGVLETKDLDGRSDATVELRDASGQVVEQFRARGRVSYQGRDSLRGYYVPTRGYVGQPGMRYTLRASAPGVEPVEATLILPAPTTIESGSYAPKSNFRYGPGRLSFTVADNAATTDYYVAYARVLDAAGKPWGQIVRDYNTTENNGSEVDVNRFQLTESRYFYSVFPLSDVGRNGQRISSGNDVTIHYTGAYNPTNPTPPDPAFIEVIVSNITPDAYNFYQSLRRYSDVDGNPFAEPAPLRSNVKPGYGLFGGAADVTFRIPL